MHFILLPCILALMTSLTLTAGHKMAALVVMSLWLSVIRLDGNWVGASPVFFLIKKKSVPISGAHGVCSLWFPFEKGEAAYSAMSPGVCWWRCVPCYRTGSAHPVTYLAKGRRVGYPTHPPALCKVSCSCCRPCTPSWNSRHHRHTGTVSLLCLRVCLCLSVWLGVWLSLFPLKKEKKTFFFFLPFVFGSLSPALSQSPRSLPLSIFLVFPHPAIIVLGMK